MTVVDLHSHFFPEQWPDLAERFGTPDWPWMRRDDADRATVMMGSQEFRSIHLGLLGPGGAPGRHGPRWRRPPGRLRHPSPLRSTAVRPSTPWSAPASSTTPCSSCARAAAGSSSPIGQVPLQDTDLACREAGALPSPRA